MMRLTWSRWSLVCTVLLVGIIYLINKSAKIDTAEIIDKTLEMAEASRDKIVEDSIRFEKDNNVPSPDEWVPTYKTIRTEKGKISIKTASNPESKKLILFVSSLGRSGSSYVGGLIANTTTEVMYLFEPFKMLTDVTKTPINAESIFKTMSSIFNCEFTKSFEKFQRWWPVSFRKYPDECDVKKYNCFSAVTLSERCKKASTILVKTIRLPLKDVEPLLQDVNFQHLKVIFFARDLRAQILSRNLLVMTGNFPNKGQQCERVMDDINAFSSLSKRYPGQFYFLRYEDTCRNFRDEAGHLIRFLETDAKAEIPVSWKRFIQAHEKTRYDNNTKKYAYSLDRNTKKQWYWWRYNRHMKQQILTDIENSCGKPLQQLGYNLLHKVANVKNLSIPFIKEYDCKFWNCWSYRF